MPDAEKSMDVLIRTKADLAAQKEVIKSNRELKDSYTVISKEQAAQILQSKQGEEQDKKEFASKRELKHAIHGLSEEFPLLASVARMALNPITLVTAGIGAAFWIFKERVEGATKALAGLELPDSKPLEPGRINQAAEAWRNFSEALRAASDAYNSVGATAERASKAISAESEELHKNLEAQKALALADLEGRKGTLTDAQYDEQKRAIESRFGHREMAEDWAEKQRQLNLKRAKADELEKSATQKNREAAGIHVATPEGEASVMSDRKAAADVAQKEIKERMERMTTLTEMRGSTASQVKNAWWFHKNYGALSMDPDKDLDRAMGIEQAGLENARGIEGGYRTYARGTAARDAERKRKQRLQDEAAKEAAEAAGIRLGLPGEQSALDTATKGNIGRWNKAGLTELASRGLFNDKAMGPKIFDEGMAAVDARAHGKKLTDQQLAQEETLKTLLTSIGWNMDSVINLMRTSTNKHKAHDAEIKALQAELQKLSAQLKGNNAVPK